MNTLLDWAATRPLFTVNEAERALEMERPSLIEKLSRLARRGDLTRIERGKYTVHDDPMVYATYVETPSFISLWSGLRYYDLTTQEPTRVQVIAASHRSDLEAVAFYVSSEMFGFGKRRYREFEIFVADQERLLVDCLSRREVPAGELGALIESVDVEKVTEYVQRMGRNSVKKRVGYLLERVRGETVEALRVRDSNYPLLDLTRPTAGRPDSKWRLTVNTDAF